MAVGEFPVPPLDVVASLAGAGDPAVDFIVLDLRLPRALTALLAGAALGAAGAVFQQVTRNALVAPDVIGVSAGASLAAVAVIVLGSSTGAANVPLAALAGALVSGGLLYGLAWRGGVHGYRFVLVGIGVAALMQAGIGYVLTEGRIFEVAQAYVWLVGSVNGRGWEHVWPLATALALLLPVLRSARSPRRRARARRRAGPCARPRRRALAPAAARRRDRADRRRRVRRRAGRLRRLLGAAPRPPSRAARLVCSRLLPLAAGCGAALVVVCDLAGPAAVRSDGDPRRR